MTDQAERLEQALRAIAVLRARTAQDREAVAEAIGPELQAVINLDMARDLSDPRDIGAMREYAHNALLAHQAARQLYLGMMDTADVILKMVCRGDKDCVATVLDRVETALRTALAGGG